MLLIFMIIFRIYDFFSNFNEHISILGHVSTFYEHVLILRHISNFYEHIPYFMNSFLILWNCV